MSTDPIFCSACDGPLVPLGTLGRRTYYRCRDCGAQQSKGPPESEWLPKGPKEPTK